MKFLGHLGRFLCVCFLIKVSKFPIFYEENGIYLHEESNYWIKLFFFFIENKNTYKMKKNQLHIYNSFGVMCKKLIKTTLKFRKSGNMRISLFFPRGRGHTKIIFWVQYIYWTRSNSFHSPSTPSFQMPIKTYF